ncbi:hypothetical protein ACKYVA_22105, partial [Paenibacillus larvae]|uniref:hypothetical protein n=1 Tax=Paenibacillus larvae TaxID=1464 RepID=UPI003908361F
PILRGYWEGKEAEQEGGTTLVSGHWGCLDLWKGWAGCGPAAAGQLAAGFVNATSANVAHPFAIIALPCKAVLQGPEGSLF